ncbi:MAG: carbohydrate ABC transporter permease [Lachnospiraceae bacterium]|nr:carbohydrate ABC transporter permease [Lachnospiraceae bacterium]
MAKFSESVKTLKAVFVSPEYDNDRRRTAHLIKAFLLGLFKFIVIIGISYVILGPIIGMISNSFFSDEDAYSALVYLIPQSPTLERYQASIKVLNYLTTLKNTFIYVLILMAIQVFMCSMVGYGFARYNFPLKKLWFGCVVIMIVIPVNTIMLPLYMTFRIFDPFNLVTLIKGEPMNLMATSIPMYMMTFFATGLRSGLYIYIFNQFFRGLPKEIEEAAFVDGAGSWYTYFFIMLVNALPSVVTVAIFSLVWQYNDTFYASLFHLSDTSAISIKISTLADNVANAYSITDPNILELYTYAGIILVILPVLLIYCVLQKQFIEGVERSGIVG